MKTREQSKRLLLLGIAGCLLYVIGDFLFAATGKGQTTETVGFMVRVAYSCPTPTAAAMKRGFQNAGSAS